MEEELPHIGFCFGEYDKDICNDCPSEKECLELRDRERHDRLKEEE